jgi:hypothetical protein
MSDRYVTCRATGRRFCYLSSQRSSKR